MKSQNSAVYSICITSDDKYIISGYKDSTIRIWNLETGICEDILKGHTDYVN